MDGRAWFLTVEERSSNKEKKGAGMNPVVLDWNWRVQYELRVFNVYTGGILIEGRTEGGVDVFVFHNYTVYNYNV